MRSVLRVTPAVAAPLCEVLFELSGGQRSVFVGRLLKGHDAGRLVSLRRLQLEDSEAELLPLVDIARSIAHSSLVKVLGVVGAGGERYLASEYIPGVTLLELRRAVMARQLPLPLPVALRIILDALNAASLGQDLLRQAAGASSDAHLYPEHIQIAEYGETMLSEVGIASYLRVERPQGPRDDLATVARELFRLVTASDDVETAPDHPLLPKPLQAVLRRALSAHGGMIPSRSHFSIELLALAGVPAASDEAVSDELLRLVGSQLDVRRGKIDLLARGAAQQDSDESTQFYRTAQITRALDVETVRPPADSTKPPAALIPKLSAPDVSGILPTGSTIPPAGSDDDDDDPTQMWRSDHPLLPHVSQSKAPVAVASSAPPKPVVVDQRLRSIEPEGALDITEIPRFRTSRAPVWFFVLALLLAGLAVLAHNFGY